MKKYDEFLDLPILGITEGIELAKSDDLLIDASKKKIAAVIINNDCWYGAKKLLPYTDVVNVGLDAILVKNQETIFEINKDDTSFKKILNENIKIIGTKVINKGNVEGIISDIIFNDNNGQIEKVIMLSDDKTEKEISSNKISIFGKEVTITEDSLSLDSQYAKVLPVDKKTNDVKDSHSEILEEDFDVNIPADIIPDKVPQGLKENEDNTTVEEESPTQSTEDNTFITEDSNKEEAKNNEDKPAQLHPEKTVPIAAVTTNNIVKTQVLLGKKSTCKITDDKDNLIVEKHGQITIDVIDKAKAANKLIELAMRAQQ